MNRTEPDKKTTLEIPAINQPIKNDKERAGNKNPANNKRNQNGELSAKDRDQNRDSK